MGRLRVANAREAGEALILVGGTLKMTGRRTLTKHTTRSAAQSRSRHARHDSLVGKCFVATRYKTW